MSTVIQQELEKIGSQIIIAAYEGNMKRIDELNFAAKAMQSYNDILHNTTPTPTVLKTKAVTKERKVKARKVYTEDAVIRSPQELALIMPYAPFSATEKIEKKNVEFLQIGFVDITLNGGRVVRLNALKACENVYDLQAGKIYAFKTLDGASYLSE